MMKNSNIIFDFFAALSFVIIMVIFFPTILLIALLGLKFNVVPKFKIVTINFIDDVQKSLQRKCFGYIC